MSIVITTIFDDPSYPQLPKDLKNPYNFLLPASEAMKIRDELASFLKPFESFTNGFSPCQFAGSSSKSVQYGLRLNVFVLAASKFLLDRSFANFPGRRDEIGFTEDEWNNLCNSVEVILQKYLGPQLQFIDPDTIRDEDLPPFDKNVRRTQSLCWKEKYSEEKKFQLRFECYIAFEEHRDRVQRKRKKVMILTKPPQTNEVGP